MKVWKITENSIIQQERPIPEPERGQELIKVEAIGINRADLLQMHGHYPSPDGSTIPGLEISGTIVNSNKRVSAILTSGGYSEYVCVPKGQMLSIPKNYSKIEAAAFPEALLTSYLNIFQLGKLKKSESVLIHGASSGIGSYAMQLCKAYGAKVFGSVGSIDKMSKVHDLKHDFMFNYNDSWAESVKELGGADMILDILGACALGNNLKSLKKGGKLISIAVMSGAQSNINLASVLMKNLTIIGSTLRSLTTPQKTSLIKNAQKAMYPLIEKNDIRPVIDSTYSFNQVPKALERMASRDHYGKIVIRV
jgi:putative PIG3 family NAD(P)H quinone oxidoreductase